MELKSSKRTVDELERKKTEMFDDSDKVISLFLIVVFFGIYIVCIWLLLDDIVNIGLGILSLSQTTISTHFQSERFCRRQFQI